MIDPENITNFNRTDAELEELMLFAVCVAGKNARTQAKKLATFLDKVVGPDLEFKSPFQYIEKLIRDGLFRDELEKSKLGKYGLLIKSFKYLVTHFSSGLLRKASLDELELTPGVGLKTARFFVLHSRSDSRVAVIDTHLLKYLKREFPNIDVPKVTPQQYGVYRQMENLFLQKCDEEGVTPYEGDLTCWLTKGERLKNEKDH